MASIGGEATSSSSILSLPADITVLSAVSSLTTRGRNSSKADSETKAGA